MNIRLANKFDIPYFIETVRKVQAKEFAKEFHEIDLDEDYLNSLFVTVISGGGVALIAESEETIGIAFAVITPNVWSPETFFLHNILFYVEPDWHHTRVGYKLIKEYNKQGSMLKQENRIKEFTMTAAEPLFDVDFDRFGYKMIEKVYMGV